MQFLTKNETIFVSSCHEFKKKIRAQEIRVSLYNYVVNKTIIYCFKIL